jgi:hypothetical protein
MRYLRDYGVDRAARSVARMMARVAIAGVASLALSAAPVHASYLDGDWQELIGRQTLASVVPPRASFSMVLDSARDRLILFGGNPGPKQDLWVLPMAPGSIWQSMVVNGTQPAVRFGHCAIYDPVGDRMLVFGGDSHGPRNDVWALALSGTPRWTNLATSGMPPLPVVDASAAYDPPGHRMVVFGGLRSDGTCSNEAWILSLTGPPTWSRVQAFGPPPPVRAGAQCALDRENNRLVVFGGWDGNLYLDDTWMLDLTPGGNWLQIVGGQRPSPRSAGVALFDAAALRIVLFGGTRETGPNAECWQLSLGETPEWTELSTSGQGPGSRYAGAAVYDQQRDRMVFFGGMASWYHADTHALALAGPLAWSALIDSEATNVPVLDQRRDCSAVYLPHSRELLTFGGSNTTSDFNDVWRMDLSSAAPSWWPVLTSGEPPRERHGQRAVWDPLRARMLMMGGFFQGYLNDLWALDISPTPTWRRVIITGPSPDGRMVFGFGLDPVRDRLIVVGGHSGFGDLGIPYRNDVWQLPLSGPSALTWSLLPVAGPPPSPRWIYGMQYDPPRDRFLIVGGATVNGRTNEVWALNLSGSPAWTQLAPASPLPPGRSDHGVMYDVNNDRIVIFGGYNGLTMLDDAWALTLSGAPSWSRLTPSGPGPGARDDFASAYDPVAGRMVIFGGWSGSAMLSDTWTLTWGSPPTPTEASLIESHVEPDRVRLAWHVRDALAMRAAVERRVGSAGWSSVGAPAIDGGEIMRFEDTDVAAGTRYAYRLRLNANGEETLTAETEIAVPTGYTLALAGAQPNPPQGGPLNVAFSLARVSDGRLELMDLAGRRVASRDLRSLAPGQHRIVFAEAARAEPGVYLMRLVTKERTLTAKALITR